MKKLQIFSVVVLLLTLTMSSCQIIGDIFKAGVGVGVFAVVAVIGLVIFLIAKIGGAGK
ncbi:MAG: phosphatidate cytidylyltransferase [Flavipsychrobacter sp.]|nr:phosphatidate cytidylyltransferase [Flavipsychrobacter sp.]